MHVAAELISRGAFHPPRCQCGHAWMVHHQYDDSVGRYVAGGCDYHGGCSCKAWDEAAQPEEKR